MNKNYPKLNRFKFVVAIILLVALLFAFGTSVSAHLNQSIIRDYGTNIEISTVVFRFNGKTYLDEIDSSNISLNKGQPTEIDMVVDILSTNRITVDYTISFQLENATGGTTNISSVTDAVEVYYYDGMRYVFLCMLSQIGSHTISGQMTTNHENTIPLQLVYSVEAAEYYDNIVNTGAGAFRICATANASVNTSNSQLVFADDFDEFSLELNKAENAGKTLVLLDDITVPDGEELTINYKMGIDLFGNTLTLNEDININYSNSTAQTGIINSGTVTNGTKAGGISGSGTINVTGDDCYLIDNYLTSGYNISMSNASDIFDDFTAMVKENLKALSSGAEYIEGDDVSFIFDNLYYYNTLFGLTIDADTVVQASSGGYIIDLSADVTSRIDYAFTYSYTGGLYEFISGYALVRGTSLVEVKNHIVAELPTIIKSAIYLKGYDSATGSYISWEIDDSIDGLLLDSNGQYRTQGITALASAVNSFADKSVDIILTITKGAESSTFVITKSVQVLSAEEITSLIYNNLPIVLHASSQPYSIYDDYLDSTLFDKSGISAITIVENPAHNYITIGSVSGHTTFNTIEITSEASIANNSVTEIPVTITFTYGSGVNEKTYTISTTVTVAGEVASVTVFDMGYYLQNAFSNNDYIDGLAYSFYGFGGLTPSVSGDSVAVYIDYIYEIPQTSSFIAKGYTAGNGYFTSAVGNTNSAKDYIVVTYEYIEVAIEDMDSQVAYFTYDSANEEYVIVTGTLSQSVTYYERKANVEVLPSRIPEVVDSTATIYAVLYTDIVNGEKVYIDPTTDETSALVYTLSLDIFGVYTNSDNRIYDYNLYTVLRSCFDTNGDGIIGRREADAEWSSAIALATANNSPYLKYSTIGGVDYYYIDFGTLDISNIKGIEYFPNIEGICLSNNEIVDITYLAQLDNIVYLDLSENAITDISALSYMDALIYLDLDDNSITSIEPLRYLASISKLSLKNNRITDFAPLTVTTALTSLDISGMENSEGLSFTTDADAMYNFALININNPSVVFTYDNAISISDAMKVAAAAMRDLEEVNRAYKTLYLPSTYYYYDGSEVVQYRLDWYCEDITFNRENGVITSYELHDLLFEKPTDIRVQVLTAAGVPYSLTRKMDITLEAFETTSNIYIYDYVNSTYIDALIAIPDIVLLNLIFDEFNVNDARNQYININGVDVAERQVISADDFADYLAAQPGLINWSNRGITNLSGIGYFTTLLTKTLNLSGNAISDISALAELALTGLTLGGQQYDFTQLNGITTLLTFDIHECYGLDTTTTLNSIFEIYWTNPSVSVYLESGVVWNPYARILPKIMQSLNSTASFVHRGQTYNIYGENQTSLTFTMYGHSFEFTVSDIDIYDWYLSTSSSDVPYFTVDTNSGIITYSVVTTSDTMYGYIDTAYAQIKLVSDDDSHSANIEFEDYYLQLNVDDTGSRIIVYNVSAYTDFDVSTVGDMFSSRYITQTVLSKLYYRFSQNYCKLTSSPTDTNANGKIDDSEMLAFLKSSSRTIGGTACYNYWYYDSQTDCYYITTDAFRTLGTSGPTSTIGSMTIDGVRSGDDYLLEGLKYISTVYSVTVSRDFHFGDGSELVNLTTLTVIYSTVDFSTLSTQLTRLTSFSATNCFAFSGAYEDDGVLHSGLSNIPNLTKLKVERQSSGLYMNDYYFLTGLIDSDGKSSLTELTLKSVGQYGITNENAEYVKQVYVAAVANDITPIYYVGSPASNSASGNFLVTDYDLDGDGTISEDETDIPTYNSGGVHTRWGAAASLSLEVSSLDAYNTAVGRMWDLGLVLNGNVWIEQMNNGERITNLTSSDVIMLPSSTGETYYGLSYAGDTTTIERDYSLSWQGYVSINGSVTEFTPAEDTAINLMSTYGNSYVVFVGTVQSGISGADNKCYFYQFTVGSGDGVYSAVTDLTLRAWLFSHRNSVGTSISISGNQSNKNVLIALGKTDKNILYYDSTESNYIYSLTGIDTVIAAWGKTTTITSVTLNNQRFSDISPLFALTNLHNLDLSCTNDGYATLDGINTGTPKLQNLTTLDLTNNISITPEDIALLATSASSRTSLTSIRLYGTRCMGNLGVLSSLQTIADANSGDSINLTLNDETADDVTATELGTFVSDVGANSGIGAILRTGITAIVSSSISVTNNSITNVYYYSLPTDVSTMITNHASQLSAGAVDIKMIISCAGASSQLTNIYADTTYTYTTSASTPTQFGTTGLYIDSFDTQLIAYLWSNDLLEENNDGYLVLNGNVTIGTEAGIENFENINLLRSANTTLTIEIGSNKLAYIDEGDITTSGSRSLNTRTISFDDSLVYLSLLSNYSYSSSSYFPYEAVLPTHIWLKGTVYLITWSTNDADTSHVYFTGGSGDDLMFTLSGAPNGNVYSSSNTTSFKRKIYASIVGSSREEKELTIDKTAAVTTTSSNMFVEVTVIGENDSYTDAYSPNVHYDTQGHVVLLNSDGDACMYLGAVEYSVLYKVGNTYYAKLTDLTGATPVYAVSPNAIFQSSRLVNYIINTRSQSTSITTYGSTNIYGRIVTTQRRLEQTEITVSTSSEAENQGVTTIEGIQMYCNLTSLTIFSGNFTSLEPLKNLSLTTFYYGNSQVGTTARFDYSVYDFTPLLCNSKNTLQYFTYNAIGSVQMTDLSFLLGFTNLQEVYVCSRIPSNYSSTVGAAYLKTASFQYVLSQLNNKGIEVYVNTARIAQFDLKYDATKVKYIDVSANATNPYVRYYTTSQSSSQLCYALVPTAEYSRAADILGEFATDDLNVTYLHDSMLSVSSGAYTTTLNRVTFNVTATVNKDGTLYLIEWRAASANVEIDANYYLTNSATIDGTYYAANTALTDEQLSNIIASTDYYTYAKNGVTKLYTTITANVGRIENLTTYEGTRLICRIYVGEYAYERMLLVDFT